MPFCLTPQATELLKQKLKEGEITPKDLNEMDSEQRHGYFTSILGEPTATKLNEMVESKLLLKNQQRGLVNGLKAAFGENHPSLRDAVSKVMRMEKILKPEESDKFMADLAAHKIGSAVTVDQAAKIYDLAKETKTALDSIPKDSPNGSDERLRYGNALVALKEYQGGLKGTKTTIPELLKNPMEMFTRLSGLSKSLVANLNNHFFGRQGWRTLFDRPDVWAKNFAKSWGDMGKELQGIDAMAPIRAEIWSRENSINGLYRIHKVDVGLENEEAIPEHLPGKIPLLGKLYKASESAFNGAALRMRADTFDALVKEAKENGVDVRDPETNLGTLANSITARGKVDLGNHGRFINAVMFSPKYLKSELDALAAVPDYLINKTPLGSGTEEAAFSRKKAAENVLKTAAGIAGIMVVAKMLDNKSVDTDPRSSRFGKIWVGNNHEIGFDITAGMGSLITLAARSIPTEHNGKWAQWYETGKGRFINLDKSREIHPMDLAKDFMEQRASPLAGFALSYLDHKYFDKDTLGQKVAKLVEPMQTSSLEEIARDKEKVDSFMYALVAGAGFMGIHEGVKQEEMRKQ